MKEKISCGLCQIYIEDGDDWEKHVNSKEHQQNLANLGGAKAIVERKMFADKIIGNNPEMKKAADKLFDDTNTKMKNILTGKKGFNIAILLRIQLLLLHESWLYQKLERLHPFV